MKAAVMAALVLLVPLGAAEHVQTTDGRSVSFDHKTGNEWWVEVVLGGADASSVSRVDAMDTDGAWVPLEKRSWGAWAASFHIEPGHDVRFRAGFADGAEVESCWFTHPGGVEECSPQDDRLAAATYVSVPGVDHEDADDVAVDSDGTAVVAGGALDTGFVSRYRADGTLEWTRTFSGRAPSAVDLDDEGNIYLAGVGSGPGNSWQSGSGGDGDVWVTKLRPDGSRVWATSFGGSERETVYAVAVAESGVVLVGGLTNSCDFPTYGPASQPRPGGTEPGEPCNHVADGFVTRLTANGRSPVYSTFLGGGVGTDVVVDLDVSAADTTHVVGHTRSASFPVTPDARQPSYGGRTDGFYAVLDGFSEVQYATYMGGGQGDGLTGVAVADGLAHVSGSSASAQYPTTADGVQPEHSGGLECGHLVRGGPDPEIEDVPCRDITLTVFDAGHDIVYSTFYGNQHPESSEAVAVGPEGRMHVTGSLRSEEAFPTTEPPIGPGGGHSDLYLLTVSADGGEAERAVRLGGSEADRAAQVAVGPDGSVWLAGETLSEDIPTSPGAEQRRLDQRSDGYLARFPPAAGVTFDSRNGNEWWVQVHVTDAEPDRVQARDTGDPWHELTLRDWGDWAASFHVEPGHDVRYRALVDGAWHESCWFTHPEGKAPDGGDACTAGGAPPPSDGGFDAAFDTPGGNEWWVEVYVDADEPLAGVEARDDGGAWVALEKKDWGAWARSFHVEDGSIVEFRATSTDGDRDVSGGYRWPGGEPVD